MNKKNRLNPNYLLRKLQNAIKISGAKKDCYFKSLIVFATLLIVFLIFNKSYKFDMANYKIGEIIRSDYISPIDFSVDNNEKTENIIKLRLAKLPAIFSIDQEVEKNFYDNIITLFSDIKKIKNNHSLSVYAKRNRLAKIYPFLNLSKNEWNELFRIINYEEITNTIYLYLVPYFRNGIVSSKDILTENLLRWGKNQSFTVIKYPNGNEITKSILEIITVDNVIEEIGSYKFQIDKLRKFILQVMRYYLTSNITFDREETLKREKIVIENTQPVKDNFFKRQIILQNGKIFTDKDKRIITVLNNFLATNVTVKRIIGLSLFILLSFLLLFFYIKKFAANIFRTNEAYLVLFFDFIVFLVVMLFINFLIGTSSSSFLSFYALPFSFFTIVIILFLDTNLAIYASLILSIIASFFFGYGIDVLLYGIVNSAFTIYFTKDIFKRTTLFFNFLLFGFLSISVPILFGLMKGFPGGIIFYNSISVIIGNLLSYILLISFVPLFESIFDITTTFQMIELLSGEHPALKNLTLVAPGTYQHSVAVGNLSEPAALEIDANPIIAKLGAHFHDIGKVKTPNYFIENQFNGKNPHDKIGPLISAKYLRQHVTYGYELSLEYMLPKPVRKIILEHHGTTFMKYFYKKAKDMFDDGKIKELDENEFRYQGNKPTFKESAIVMFADRVEAQSRILKNYRYSTIKNMVMDTLNKLLIEEEQFSNCPITLQELYKVANSFIKTIQTMYHKRIEYEKQNKS